MCGIIGVMLREEYNYANEVLKNGLDALQYRGYDSAGGLILASKFHIAKILKEEGKELDVEKIGQLPPSHTGLAHTRWATSSKVTKENQHPHLSPSGHIAVVHNGIIENQEDIREFLSQNNIEVANQTDTALIPALIEHYTRYYSNFFDGLRGAIEYMKGKNSFVALNTGGVNNSMYGVHLGEPLYVGENEEGTFISSDPEGFSLYTDKGYKVKEGEIAYIDGYHTGLTSAEYGTHIDPEKKTFYVPKGKVTKEGYDHYMQKEISQQSSALKESFEANKEKALEAANAFKSSSNVIFVGSGTAHISAQLGKELLRSSKKEAYAFTGGEWDKMKKVLHDKSCVVFISQSGTTGELLDIRDKLSMGSNNIQTIGVINVEHSDLAESMDILLPNKVGPERAVASTKATSAQLQTIYMLDQAYQGKEIEEASLAEDYESMDASTLHQSVKNVAQSIHEDLKSAHEMFVIGKGAQSIIASEGEIKIREVAYLPTRGFESSTFKHGPLACVHEGLPIVALLDSDTAEETMKHALEAKVRGAHIYGIGPEEFKDNPVFDKYVVVPKNDELQAGINLYPVQLLAYQLGCLKGIDVDQPRNLAKSVTVK